MKLEYLSYLQVHYVIRGFYYDSGIYLVQKYDILLDRRILGTGKVFFQRNCHHILSGSNPVDILSKWRLISEFRRFV